MTIEIILPVFLPEDILLYGVLFRVIILYDTGPPFASLGFFTSGTNTIKVKSHLVVQYP